MAVKVSSKTCELLAGVAVTLVCTIGRATADEPAAAPTQPAAAVSPDSPTAQPEAKPEPAVSTAAPPTTTVPAPQTPVSAAAVTNDPNKPVRLDFQGQQWLPVLEWLAKVRTLNLDWQTLPEGTVNLASAKEYSVDEAEDLINMQLLSRGFTLLQHGEVLRVSPLKNLDVTLVP